jgi:hypothetical protein
MDKKPANLLPTPWHRRSHVQWQRELLDRLLPAG